MPSDKAIWEQRGKSFPRNLQDAEDTIAIMDFFRANGANFKDKRVIDIGCGNGRFAFAMAREAKSVLGIDISTNMLNALNADAKALGLTNITTLESAWRDYNSNEVFDIALASLTPALNHKEAFLKVLPLYKECFCYVGWGRVRECEAMDYVLKLHNLKLELPIGLPNVLEWLGELGVANVAHFYMIQDFPHNLSIEKAKAEARWNIEAHGGVVDEAKIEDFIAKYAKNDKVEYLSHREIGIAVIPKL